MESNLKIFPELVLTEHLDVYKSSFTSKWECDTVAHNYGHLDLITKGCLLVKKDGQEYYAKENKMIFVPSNITYHQKVETTPYRYHSFLFSYLENEETKLVKSPIIFTPRKTDYYLDRYKQAYHLYITKPVSYKLKIRKIIYEVLDKICEETFLKETSPDGYYTIKKSVEYINENYADPQICSETIASFSNITPTYFRRIFKKIHSVTPNKYINNLRINKAKIMLENTDYTIDEIAYRCGYNDYSYFSKVFYTHTGLAPSIYRTKYNQQNKKENFNEF